MKKQVIVLVLAAVLVFGCAIGGTFAWLSAKTNTIVNTFTYGNVSITLTETNVDGDDANANSYKMVPGTDIAKDPTVTVLKDSEDCYVFIKIDDKAEKYLSYQIADGWTELEGGVWYTQKADITENIELSVLKDNKVTVKSNVPAADIEALRQEGATLPTLEFTAYAIQKDGFNTVEDAWAQASTLE